MRGDLIERDTRRKEGKIIAADATGTRLNWLSVWSTGRVCYKGDWRTCPNTNGNLFDSAKYTLFRENVSIGEHIMLYSITRRLCLRQYFFVFCGAATQRGSWPRHY